MSITIFHMKSDLSQEDRYSITFPNVENWVEAMADGTYTAKKKAARLEAAAVLFANEGYEAVAKIDTDDLETAWVMTQNGIQNVGERYGLLSAEQRGDVSRDEFVEFCETYGGKDAFKAEMAALVSSWSRLNEPAVSMIAEAAHVGHDGKLWGRKSSEVGDIFQTEDGKFYIVADFGFHELGIKAAA